MDGFLEMLFAKYAKRYSMYNLSSYVLKYLEVNDINTYILNTL
jgi:hypothetical protein